MLKQYELETVFNFGKYKGKPLKQVFCVAPSYIDWCLREVTNFAISQYTFDQLKSSKPKYYLSPEAKKYLLTSKKVNHKHSNDYSRYNYNNNDLNCWRISQHPELQDRSEHEAIELIDLADEIGCEPEDLIANLDM
jgi:hypothetical protein